MNNPYKFGSTLDYDFQLYVKRPADSKLQGKITEDLCYIFNARKLGKSSLLMRVIQQLELNGDYICVYFEIPSIEDKNQDEKNSELNKKTIQKRQIRDCQNLDMFYDIFLDIIIEQLEPVLNLEFSTVGQWNQKFLDSNINGERRVKRFFQYISQEFEDRAKVIVFIDEVDSVQSLPFNTDSFFRMIRGLCNDKTRSNIFKFCLVGVAKVSDLVKDAQITSFNLGTGIELTGFKLGQNNEITEDLKILITPELENKAENPNKVLQFVIKRTGGQPFLTQKFLSLIIDHINQKIPKGEENEILNNLENKYIVKNWRHQDNPEHFKTIERRIINYIVKERNITNELTNAEETAARLNMYSQILTEQVVADDLDNQEKEIMDDLILSGLIINDQGILKPYCPIYEEIFNSQWIERHLKKITPNWYRRKKTAWKILQDNYYLLYGQELKTANDKKYNKLTPDDENFVHESAMCYHSDKEKLSDKFEDQQKEIIIDRLRYWTNYQRLIFNVLIQIINCPDIDNPITGLENDWVDSLVEKEIIKNWEKIDNLNKIYEQIKDRQADDRFSLLVVYGRILYQGKVIFSDSDQSQNVLLEIGLVKKRFSTKDDYILEVSNLIYKNIFNESYIQEQLPNIRGYGKKLGMWLITQDDQYLLSAEELESNIVSLNNQTLSEDENLFLVKSQLNILNRV